MNWTYFKVCFSSANRTPPEWFIFTQQQTLSNQLLTSVLEAGDEQLAEYLDRRIHLAQTINLNWKQSIVNPWSYILFLPTRREKIGIKYNYIPLQILLLSKQAGEKMVQFSPLITHWEILSWCSITQKDWSTQQINFIPGIMYTLSWEKISLNIRVLCISQPKFMLGKKNNKAMSFRVSWLVAPVTKTLPLNSRASGAAFEFVAAAQCHRGEQGQMQLHKMLSKSSAPILGCTTHPCPGVVQKTI